MKSRKLLKPGKKNLWLPVWNLGKYLLEPGKKKNKPLTPQLKSRKILEPGKKKSKPLTPRLKSTKILEPGKKQTFDSTIDI